MYTRVALFSVHATAPVERGVLSGLGIQTHNGQLGEVGLDF
jgi:hypothetical protein